MIANKKQINVNISRKVFAPIYLKEKILEDKSRTLILYGGAGSGKSHGVSQKILFRILSEKNHKFLVVRQVQATLKDSVFDLFVDLIHQWGLQEHFHITKSPLEITCSNGNKILFKGLDNVEKLKSISNITGIWVEEASEIKQTDLQQLHLRLRGKKLFKDKYAQIILTFNPISQTHWLKRHFFDKVQPDTRILKTTYLDNPFLDDSYVERLSNLKDEDENYYRIYALGEWGALGNLIYTKYKVETLTHDDDYYDNIFYGLDFGWNDPSALVKVGVKDDRIYVLDEIYKQHLTNTELIEVLKKRIDSSYWITGDSSEPARIQDIKKAGFKIKGAKKEKGSIQTGIDFIRSKEMIIDSRCSNFIKEIQGYKYREDKQGNVLESPVDFNNHLLDALRYSLIDYKKATSKTKKGRSITKASLGL